ncbi:holin family protein [Oscillibacter sp.]|uniref:phage holin family protein n=1 Tax=Oscillibacter sp. TaxID=1945593 RepID=UPI0028B14BC4|nr:phage holin family protein [Oscillibacter sp.]
METLGKVINILFGDDNNRMLHALIILVVLDYITGVCVAILERRLSSEIGAKGIAGKVMIFVLVALSNVADTYFLLDGNALETVTVIFYCANESISIVENAGKMGIPLPQKLLSVLEKLKDKNG